MKFPLNDKTKEILMAELIKVEDAFDADLLFYQGSIGGGLEGSFKKVIEDLKKDNTIQREKLLLMLTTNGGVVETVERIVSVLRKHYRFVDFIIPDKAMSAGTVLALSGDNIYMNYMSALGPIDPQVYNGSNWVPVMGYLDKINGFMEKARNGQLTNAEFLILKDFDLALLSSYEQACNLTIDLLKRWLVQYKFSTWNVTSTRKATTATEIAKKLGDHQRWLSHGRYINIERLRNDLKLKIEDYSDNEVLRTTVDEYFELVTAYINEKSMSSFFHTRAFI